MANTFIGADKLKKLFIGTTKVKKIYLGTDLVFSDGFSFTYNGTTYEESTTDANVEFTRNDDGTFALLLKRTSATDFVITSLPEELIIDICCVGGGAAGVPGTGWATFGNNRNGEGGHGGSVVNQLNVSLSVDTPYSVISGVGGIGGYSDDAYRHPGSSSSFGSIVSASGGNSWAYGAGSNGNYIFDSTFDSRLAGASGAGAFNNGGTTGGGNGGNYPSNGTSGTYWGAGGGGGHSYWNDGAGRTSGSGYQGIVAIRGRLN